MVNSGKILGRMRELGVTQDQCSKAIGVAQPTYSQKINNVRPMDLVEAEKLAKFLEIPDTDFGSYFFSRGVAETRPV